MHGDMREAFRNTFVIFIANAWELKPHQISAIWSYKENSNLTSFYQHHPYSSLTSSYIYCVCMEIK